MSEENVEGVRQALTETAMSQRSPEERFGSRFPRLAEQVARLVARVWGSLPLRSRLRKALLRRYLAVGAAASGRGNLGAAYSLIYHPDIVLDVPQQLVGLGFDRVSHGREERIRFQEKWVAEWGQFAFVPEEVIDLGDRVLVVGRIKGSGLASGAGFDEEWADLFTLSGGLAIREQAFFDHGEGFRAAGLPE
jgi:ketosteroid isomerase-like protein